MSAEARGIAEAESVGTAANAQAATPISNNRFIWNLPGAAASRQGVNVFVAPKFPRERLSTAVQFGRRRPRLHSARPAASSG
jgi:hypothetical protein